MLFFGRRKKKRKIPYMKEIEKIHEYHDIIKDMSQDDLAELALHLREEEGIDENKRKAMAYAVVFEVIKRTLGITPYDVQLSGGIALREGNIAQMRTGEGKTVTALFPAFWGYVSKQQTYVITVNEYLAERDYLEAKKVFNYLKINIGLVLKDMDTYWKKKEYDNPIVYITNSEFAFDYLRDNIATHKDEIVQKPFDFVIIDEADLVLIDEAKNPVIITGQSEGGIEYVDQAKIFVDTLIKGEDFILDKDYHIPVLTERAFEKGKNFFGYEIVKKHELYNAINQALLAKENFKKDRDYIIQDGKIQIVDKYTGRVLKGRRFQHGLHQAIERKENVEVNPENAVVATTTYQSLFRKFKVKSGMTGTAIESKDEFQTIYGMDVIEIPTNKPVQRIDHHDILFQTKDDKYKYLEELVKERYQKGQPLLIGTTSIDESEDVAEILRKAQIPFHLLNAKNDKEESEIVKRAGEKGAVTISTNMAGRGTDIKISEEVEKLGGLFVIGTSRNESKRIDRQLRGRSGRQGQKGESIFLTSIEDELVRLNLTHKVKKFIEKNKEYPITSKIATKLIDEIQEMINGQHASIRKLQFEMDEILHYQREYVYGLRRNILFNGLNVEKMIEELEDIIKTLLEPFGSFSDFAKDEWDISGLKEMVKIKLGIELNLNEIKKEQDDITGKDIYDFLLEKTSERLKLVDEFFNNYEDSSYKQYAIQTAIATIDRYWITFLYEVEDYKNGFGLLAMGEQEPIRKFQLDVDKMFQNIKQEAYLEFFRSILAMQETLLSQDNKIIVRVG